jgi:hypothetical protein
MKLQRLGGYAAIVSALVFAPMIVLSLQLEKQFGSLEDPAKFMAAATTAPFNIGAFNALFIAHFILMLVSNFALCECVRNKAPRLARMAVIASSAGTAFLIATSIVYLNNVRITFQHAVPLQDFAGFASTMNAIAVGLTQTGIHCYGWAALLMGWAILQTRLFSAILGWFSVLLGLLAIAHFMLIWFPSLITAALHPLVCVATLWIGIALLRQKQLQPALEEMAVSR